MPKLKLLILFSFLSLTVLLTGCIQVKSNKKGPAVVDGGVFKTTNQGTLWRQKTLIPTVSGKPKNFSAVNVVSMAIDPSDHQAIYFGSAGSGLFYTYDGGENWRIVKGLGQATIRDVAVDPGSKCIIYAAIGNKIHKSSDCNRTWSRMYLDNDLKVTIDAIAIDHYDSNNVYIGLSRGDIIKSSDRGGSWRTIKRLDNKIEKILVDPNDSRNIYVVTNSKGIFRSTDNGKTWDDFNKKLNEKFKKMKLGMDIKDLVLVNDKPGVIFIATHYGLLRSNDNGEEWENIKLIPPKQKAVINALAVNFQDTEKIYYVTNYIFYRSVDGGKNWTTIKLPTTRAGWRLLVDPKNSNVIYMGVKSLGK